MSQVVLNGQPVNVETVFVNRAWLKGGGEVLGRHDQAEIMSRARAAATRVMQRLSR